MALSTYLFHAQDIQTQSNSKTSKLSIAYIKIKEPPNTNKTMQHKHEKLKMPECFCHLSEEIYIRGAWEIFGGESDFHSMDATTDKWSKAVFLNISPPLYRCTYEYNWIPPQVLLYHYKYHQLTNTGLRSWEEADGSIVPEKKELEDYDRSSGSQRVRKG